jgi:hypothetical protein
MLGGPQPVLTRVFSSEVDTGSRGENASNKKLEPGPDSIRTEKAPAAVCVLAIQRDAADRNLSPRLAAIFLGSAAQCLGKRPSAATLACLLLAARGMFRRNSHIVPGRELFLATGLIVEA